MWSEAEGLFPPVTLTHEGSALQVARFPASSTVDRAYCFKGKAIPSVPWQLY